MKVCIAVLGSDIFQKELMASDFYKADTYCIYDLVTADSFIFARTETTGSYLSIEELLERGVEAIISPNLRPMAGKILLDNGIVVYQSIGDSLKENIKLFKASELPEFNSVLVEAAGDSCGTSCSACKTKCN